MRDLLLPTTDAGVAVQAAILAVAFAVAWRVTRRSKDLRLLVVGSGVLLAALMGLRAAH